MAGGPTAASVWAALEAVKDPEIPVVSVVEMGMVHDVRVVGGRVEVMVTPTFVGCPAQAVIRRDIERQVRALPGVADASVEFMLDPPWTPERITRSGREKLKGFGIASPDCSSVGALLAPVMAPPCPYCGCTNTHLENVFGPTACRAIFYCDTCRNPFEAIKPV